MARSANPEHEPTRREVTAVKRDTSRGRSTCRSPSLLTVGLPVRGGVVVRKSRKHSLLVHNFQTVNVAYKEVLS